MKKNYKEITIEEVIRLYEENAAEIICDADRKTVSM